MDIAVIGAGYVGLTTAACFAEIGHHVVCAESDSRKLALLREGGVPFYEPDLEKIILQNFAAGRLEYASTNEAIERGKAIFICVGTPPLENGEADLSAIDGVARSIAQLGRGHRLVVEKSTVPVQTGRQLQKHLALYNNGSLAYDVVSNPEFLREGSAVEDFFHPDRIVIGVESRQAADMMEEIYRPVLEQTFTCPVHEECRSRKHVPFVVTDINSAEIVKHASNSFLAMKISFINMIADLCEAAGADISRVAEGIGMDRRIGAAFLRPGIGFGGFCFPKDLQAFVCIAEKFGCDFTLLREVEKINVKRVAQFVELVRRELWVLRGKKIGVWGLAFKPNTDDVRFAPSIEIIRRLLAEGVVIQAYDPEATNTAKAILPDIKFCQDPCQAADGTDAVILLTEWEEFKSVDLSKLRSLVARPLIVDGRNALNRQDVEAAGFQYICIGRNVQASVEAAVRQ